jgi:hypothetical protein
VSQSDPDAHAADLPDEVEKQWWYNLKTLRAEQGLKSAALYRVGPFATRAEAEMAPILLRERSRAWSADEAEND